MPPPQPRTPPLRAPAHLEATKLLGPRCASHCSHWPPFPPCPPFAPFRCLVPPPSHALAWIVPQASASRAANPYLQKETKEQFKEFNELVEPRRVAQGLMSILNQLSVEWSTDLRYVASESSYLRDACSDDPPEEVTDTCGVDSAPQSILASLLSSGNNVTMDLICADPKIELPAVVYSSFRAASAAWNSDLEESPSPLRAQNLDLLQRACTREAALSALKELGEAQNDSPAQARANTRRILALPHHTTSPPFAHRAALCTGSRSGFPPSHPTHQPSHHPTLPARRPRVPSGCVSASQSGCLASRRPDEAS